MKATPYELMDAFEVENMGARPVWKSLHIQPLFEGGKFYPLAEDDAVSGWLFVEGICLPSGSKMAVEEQGKVIELLKSILV